MPIQRLRHVILLACCLVFLASLRPPAGNVRAQVRPIYSRGAPQLLHLLQRLQTTASVMHIGAHPDDEDSALIARLARGDHARIAYLALNRGEGGQNVIGPELFEALGVIRSEELLQARRLDGGVQFFTRAIDYGFSKTLKEAGQKWNQDVVLGDMVRAIRRYRPQVLIARFTGTPSDGHGQHQFAGHLAPLAFRAVGDPSRYPEHIEQGLRPWQPLKFYVSEGFRPNAENPPSTLIDTGDLNPALGRTYFEIAMEGRSQHRSQGMGTRELRGAQRSGMRLVESEITSADDEVHVFDAIDTSILGIRALAGLPNDTLEQELRQISQSAQQALADYAPLDPQAILPHLGKGLELVRASRARLASLEGVNAEARVEADYLLSQKEDEFIEAMIAARGIVLDALSDRETVAPGGSLDVSIRSFYPEGDEVRVLAELVTPEGTRVEPSQRPKPEGRRRFRQEHGEQEAYFRVTVSENAHPSEPYFLASKREGDLYAWGDEEFRGEAFSPASLRASVRLDFAGVSIMRDIPVAYRGADRSRGELRRNVDVVPALSVNIEPALWIVPVSSQTSSRNVAVQVVNNAVEPMDGTLSLELPNGWRSDPDNAPFSLNREGQSTSVVFEVSIPPGQNPGPRTIGAHAAAGGHTFNQNMRTIEYPHIQTHRLYSEATSLVQVLDLELRQVRVGYIMGSGDKVPEAIRRMGLPVTMLDAEDLATGDLEQYDTIVVGIRASQVRNDFVSNHGRLLDFVSRGGTLITQYQQTDYVAKELAPYPVKMDRPKNYSNHRVTDETAQIQILVPDHPVFNAPNKIVDPDWDGWVQERSLYHFSEWSEEYMALLEAGDPDEESHRGSLLVAKVGEGHYVYTGISWFRQFPAGVPGAYRLFANLLALGH